MFSKKSVVLKWACSYVVILMIPVIAIFANHYFNMRVLEEEAIRLNEQTLINLQEYVDRILEDEIELYNYLCINDAFVSLLNSDEKDKYFYNSVNEFIEIIKNYRINDTRLTGMVCIIARDYVVDASAGGNSRNFYESKNFINEQGITYDDWMEKISLVYKNEFFVSNNFRRDSKIDQIIYANTVTYFGNKSANIFVFFPVSEIARLTENSSNKIILEMDDEDILYISSGRQMPIPEDIEIGTSGELIIAGDRYICLRKTSSVGNLTYKMLIPEQKIKEESLHTRNALLICLALVILIGGLCVRIFLKSNMRPLLNLLNKLGVSEKKGNEYTRIEEVYNILLQKNIDMQKEIFEKSQRLQNREILDFFKGKKRNNTEGNVLGELHKSKELCLVGFKIPLLDNETLQHDEVLYNVTDNLFSELMADQQFYKIHDGQCMFFLFVIDKEQEKEWRQNCLKQVDCLKNFIEDKIDKKIIAVIGGYYGESFDELRFLYREVVEGFSYVAIIGGNEIVDLADTYMEDMQPDLMITIELAMQKVTSEEMLKCFTRVFMEIDNSQLQVIRVRLLETFQMLLQYIYKYSFDETKSGEFLRHLESVLSVKSKENAKQMLKGMLLYVYERAVLRHEKGRRSIVDDIKEYIELHYSDAQLSVKKIAFELGWNHQYIGRIFREEMDEGIVDYINRIRIFNAVKLLNGRNLSIEEVTEQVGYASSDNFRRIFKQKMGVSPNKYNRNSGTDKEGERGQ